MAANFGRRNAGGSATVAAGRVAASARPAQGSSSKGLLKALLVFAYFFYLAAQTYTGFLYEMLGGIRPKAAVVLDNIVDVLLVSWLGVTAASVLLLALAVGFAVLVYVREPRPRG